MSFIIKNAHAILSGLSGGGAAGRAGYSHPRRQDCGHRQPDATAGRATDRRPRLRDLSGMGEYAPSSFSVAAEGRAAGLNQSLTAWLSATPYRFRAAFDEHTFRLAVRIGLVELLRSGCASVADHNYLYWPDMPFDTSEILFSEGEALGMRIVLCRGGATQGRAVEQDLPVALRPETFDGYMADIERLVSRYHDPRPDSLRRVVMAPTTVLHSAPGAQLREMAKLARQLGIRLHSHLSETVDYLDAARQKFAMTPVQFCAEHDWLGNDVWFAHLVKLLPEEIALLGRTGTGIAHCPQSNGRLGSGIADLLALEQAGVPVSLGWTALPPMKRRICKAKPMPHGCCSARAKGCWRSRATPEAPSRAEPMRPRWRMWCAGAAPAGRRSWLSAERHPAGRDAGGPRHLPAGRSALLRPA